MNNSISNGFIIFMIFNFLFTSIQAQDSTKNITLQQAIDLSIRNSKNLTISKAKIEEANAVLVEAKNSQLPDFKISGSYLRLNSANIDLKSKSDTVNSGPGIKVNQALYGTATLSMPLFAGGRIKYGIESARLLKEASMLDAEQDKDAVIFNCTKAFVNLYKSYEAVLVVKENLQSSLSRDTNFANLEKNGLLARNDLLKSQLQTSNIELSLMDAETNNKMAMVNMNLMLGLPENTILQPDSSFINVKPAIKTFTEYEDLALQKRNDVRAIGFRKKAAATTIQSAKAEIYPSIGLTGGYVAAYVPDVITITNAINIGVGVQYNLANLYKKNSSLMKAKARQTQLTASEADLQDAIRLQVNQDFQQYLLSEKKILVFEKAVEQAKENYRITKNKYDNSLVTLTELLEADVALLQAKLNSSYGKAEAVLAYNKLLETSGTISN